MRIGVLTDTHACSFEDIPQKIIDTFSTVDLIIHAGDFVTIEVLNGLKQLAETKAVQGNMDSPEIKSVLLTRKIVEIGNKKIGIAHGSGSPWGIEHRVRKTFDQDYVDIIVYGHSHQSQNKVIEGILFFNSGKATESFGILTIEGERVKGEIIMLGDTQKGPGRDTSKSAT